MSLFMSLSRISLRQYCQKNVIKSVGFGIKIKAAGGGLGHYREVFYRRSSSNLLHTMIQ